MREVPPIKHATAIEEHPETTPAIAMENPENHAPVAFATVTMRRKAVCVG